MKIAITQPYLFPYIGYFQLLGFVDKCVFLDDVQYIKRGWINRNMINLNGKSKLITFSVKKDSRFITINQRYYIDNNKKFYEENLKTISHAYKKAPYFKEIYELIREVFSYSERNVALFNINSIKLINSYLQLEADILLSSYLDESNDLKGEDRIIHLNKILNSDHYINPIGGIDLYNKYIFNKNGIQLNFLQKGHIRYSQFNNNFIPDLSIIDALMFNSKNEVKKLLTKFELI